MTSLKIEKTQETTMVVADLDGTLLHDGETFEERFLTQRSIDVINRMHDNGVTFVVETARPVSTGYRQSGSILYNKMNIRSSHRQSNT